MKRTLFLLPLLLFLLAAPTHAAVAHGQTFAVCHTTAVSSQNCTLTSVTTGTNLAGVCSVVWVNSPSGITVSTITWGGTTMPAAGTAVTYSNIGAEMFVLTNPPAGSNETVAVVLSTTETFDFYIACLTFTGVNQTTPVRPSSFVKTSATSGLTSIALTISSNTSDMTASVATNANSATMSNSSSGITFIGNMPAGSRIGSAWDYGAGASSVSDTYTWTGSSAGGGEGFSVQAAAAVTTVTFPVVY
jgi:hypothetical protein